IVTSSTSPASTLAIHTLYVGVSSRACDPLADTSFQSITPRKTIEIQKRIVFAVELEFTLSSLILQLAGKNQICLFLPPLDTFPGRPVRSGTKLPEIASRPVGRRKPVAHPYLVRCSSEAKVIRLQGHPPLRRFIQKHRQPDRARFAFAQPPQQKFLSHTAFQHRVNHQHVTAFQFRPRTKKNFAPRVPAVLDVPHLFAHEVTNNRRIDLPHQVRRENKTAIQTYDHIQPPAPTLPRNLFPQGCHTSGHACRGIRRFLSAASPLVWQPWGKRFRGSVGAGGLM